MKIIVGRCLLNDKLAEIGLSQTQFADRINMSRSQLSDYANNRILMSLPTALKVSAALRSHGLPHFRVDNLYEWKIIER